MAQTLNTHARPALQRPLPIRDFLKNLAQSTCAAAMLAIPAVASAATGPVLAIDTGKIEGTVEQGIASWKGIPYATPPLGALRWRGPQPIAAWNGVRPAMEYGADCMQLPFPSGAAPLGTDPSEDCLFVNVWKPAAAGADAKLPVIVWIHGGGFVNGGASPPTFSGAVLARQGVVVVGLNYRIGRFGFFAHPALTRENAAGPEAGLLGNYGVMDQIAALKWVQRNVGTFGGNPSDVTIMGESAGGMSVNTLLTAPLAQGLFAKAVTMSGGEGRIQNPGLAAVEQIGINFAASKNISAEDPQAVDKLRALSAEQIVDGMNFRNFNTQGKTFASLFVDGKIVVDAGAAFAAGRFAKVPLMIGATSADIGGKTGWMVAGARSLAATIASHGAPVYAYRFSYVADSIGQPGARHASDVPYFFSTVDIKYGDKATKKDIGMGETISTYLVNFAKKGDPNGGKLPAWPRYLQASDQLMDFAASGKAVAQKDPWGADIDAAQSTQAAAK